MAIPKLSRESEARILDALEDVAADEAAEADPDAAIAKAAADRGVPHGHLGLLVHAYNNSQAAVQRLSGDTVREKSAAFPMARLEAVVAALYPDADAPDPPRPVKAAAGPGDAAWFARRRAERARADKNAELRAKVAALPKRDPEPTPEPPWRFHAKMAAARDAAASLDRDRLEVVAAEERTARVLGELADELIRPGAPAWADVKEAAAVLHGAYGSGALDSVAGWRPSLRKAASVDPYVVPADHPRVFALVKAAADGLRAIEVARTAYAAAAARTSEKVAGLLDPYLGPPEPGPDALDALLADDGPAEKAAAHGGFGERREQFDQYGIPPSPPRRPAPAPSPAPAAPRRRLPSMMDFAERIIEETAGEDLPTKSNSILRRLEDPVHAQLMRDLDARHALQNLVLNDPIISSHDPNEVASVYNELSQVSPNLGRQPLLVRPALRRALETGGLDSFDAAQAVDVEKKMRESSEVDQKLRQFQSAPR